MTDPSELLTILERILNGCRDEGDIAILRQSLKASSSQNIVQLGKYNVNIGEGKDIHIGDKIYKGTDADTIRTILLEVPSQSTRQIEIDWHSISQTMLNEQLGLTSNPLTFGEGITYRTEQVYVPLGLVERKKQPRRREDVLPEQGSELYQETEITQTFEHDQFLEQVLRHRQSPRSQGRRIAIIGEPGAGKTTLLQQIAQWVSRKMAQSVVIWVSLADLRSKELESYLLDIWLQAVARKVGQAEASTQVKDNFVAQFNQGLVWLLLDGVDKMQVTQGNPLGEIERQIRTGTLLQQARIVLSCRLNLWDGGSNALDSFDNYRTLEFSYPQLVEQFIRNWFGSLPSAEMQTGQRLCAALRESGKERIRDLVKNPLRLTLLCFNWYLGEGKLPETKAGLYEQFVADFYEWKKKQFATTGEQRKRLNAALGELAREAIDKEATRFRLRQEFVCKYLGEPDDTDSLFGLALRLGWLNKVGVEAENPRKGVYTFFHPTFQEYFAALGIDDWHYFLNHIPENPSHPKASYRIFEAQWKEVFLLWLGRELDSDSQKEEFLNALVDFKDNCGIANLYGCRAELLAAVGLSEFYNFSRAEELVTRVFDRGIREIEIFNNPIAAASRKTLQEMKTSVLADMLTILLHSEDIDIQHEAAKLAGELGVHSPKLVEVLSNLALTTEFKDTQCNAFCSLLRINPNSFEAIEGLIQILNNKNMDMTALSAAQMLGNAKVERELDREKVIKALDRFIEEQFFNEKQAIFFQEQDNAYAASCSLLKHDPENARARFVLQVLAKMHWEPIIRSQIAQFLSNYEVSDSRDEPLEVKNFQMYFQEDLNTRLSQLGLTLDLGVLKIIEALIDIMIKDSNQNNRKKAAWCLELLMHDYLSAISIDSYPQIVIWLKSCIHNSPDRNSLTRTLISVGSQDPIVCCYKGLWSISQKLHFPSFYKAWNSGDRHKNDV
ncbi:hypothetical protein NUACC21_42890 [Scytonema sp. NUACC21]